MKNGLIAVLAAANLLMFVIGIITIPPNLRAASGKGSDVPGAEQTAPVTLSPVKETPPAATESSIIPEPEDTGVSLSTAERPDWEDFLWYIDDVMENGLPEGAQSIDNVKYTLGGWKGFILYDPDNSYGANSAELLNVTIEGSDDALLVTLDWYLLLIPGETEAYDETDVEDNVFEGEWIAGGVRAFGWGELRLLCFYDLDGKQYAFGSLEVPDGTPAFVALVRP